MKYIKYLEGKKTYIVSALIVLVNALQISGIITLEPNQIEAINYLLGALALTSLRLGISKSNKNNG